LVKRIYGKRSIYPFSSRIYNALGKAINRYKRIHNIPIINKTNRDQIFIELKKKIAINYFKYMDFLKIDSYKIASHIFYFWKFAKIETKAKFENLRQNIRNLLRVEGMSIIFYMIFVVQRDFCKK
jgi:hypothetical protein